jgi:UDP-glucuronate decarboxylase
LKILITGGAGFLGSNLTKELLERGHSVICLDSFTTGSINNIEPFSKNKLFSVIEHDVRSPFEFNCDVIINMACPASPPRYQMNPIGTMMTNVLGTYHGLELARKNSARFIQASTSEIYGDPLIHPQVESYWGNVNPIGPRSCYDEGKRAAESLCVDFYQQFGVHSTVVRIFNTYGPKMARNDGRVVSNLIVQALEGKKLTIYGTGDQTRCFCYVSDLVGGFIKIIESDRYIPGPINLGSTTEITMHELGKTILAILSKSNDFEYVELPSDDPSKRKPDISRAKAELNWEPLVGLEEGLAATIEYFKGN